MKKYTVEIKVGDEIQVGRFRNVSKKIKSIREYLPYSISTFIFINIYFARIIHF